MQLQSLPASREDVDVVVDVNVDANADADMWHEHDKPFWQNAPIKRFLRVSEFQFAVVQRP